MTTNTPLWQPSPARIERALITAFQQLHGFDDYDSVYRWSIDEPEAFWRALWDFAEVRGEPGPIALENADKMPGATFFPQGRLNFAENLLRRRDEADAIVFWGEDRVKRRMSHAQLAAEVAALAGALRAQGVGAGDIVAGYLPNLPETMIAMLATACLGATWSSCSPDFGVRGVLDRFGQIEPKVLVCADGYFYNGKTHDCLAKVAEVMRELPTVERVVVVPYTVASPDVSAVTHAVVYDDFTRAHRDAPLEFTPMAFNHPMYVMFSSGTTGKPKCIVHGAGGTLLKHLCEHRLHTDVQANDRLFYFTTCGWMMWNWLASGLACGATLLLYDGSPFYPSGNILFDFAEAERCTIFGTSAKYLDALNKADIKPRETHDLSALGSVLSTGSPLAPESFDYVYRDIKSDVCLSSIAGGTDIVGCFVLGNPTLAVYRGEIQCRGLGMRVEVWDENGQAQVGRKGELVCTAPFPSMPVGFFGDDAQQSRYRAAYFERFPNVWCHGDYVELTPNGGMIIYGRSDAVLNPGGVRIGTAEIYRQVEKLPEVIEGLVVGQEWDNDVRVVLFVRLLDGVELDDALVDRIKRQIRQNTTPRHVPAKVLAVADIPRTKSGKIVELAVREVIHGRPVNNKEALANPDALAYFQQRTELEQP